VEDDALARLLVEWGLIKEPEMAEARALQGRLRREGSAKPLDEILVDFGFLTRRQIDDAVAVTEGLPAPGEELPLDVVEAQHKPEAKFGHFLLLAEIGRGGLGVVHRAWDTELRRIVALKFLNPSANLEQDRVVELLMEGSRLSRLRHPNIITVYEFGRIRGQFYLSMELLEGMGLDQLVKSARSRNQVSPFYGNPQRYLSILRDVARAVHYAHTRTPPIIHCDLKPHNIFVDLSWRPYLVDFGVARELRHQPGEEEDVVRGSPAYMAPEQVLGHTADIDARTDVYGIGAILYELLTGRPPYVGDLQQSLDQSVLVDPPAPSKVIAARVAISSSGGEKPMVPAEIEAICMKCLAKDRKNRFPNARDVADALDALVADKPIRVKTQAMPAPPPSPAPAAAASKPTRIVELRKPLMRAVRRASVVGFLGGAVLVAAAVIAIVLLARGGESSRDARRTMAAQRGDAFAAALEIEQGQMSYQEFADREGDKSTADWVRARMEELDWLRQFRDRLAIVLGRERPKIPELKLRVGALRDGAVTSASHFAVMVSAGGGERKVSWGEIAPEEVVRLAYQWPADFEGKPRLGMAIYALKNRLFPEARTLLRSLDDPLARKYLAELPPEP
jgi:serine/threonine protein kinase